MLRQVVASGRARVSMRGVGRWMSSKCLVVAEHDGARVSPGTLSAVTAARRLGEVSVLVVGEEVGGVAAEAAKVAGVAKVETASMTATRPSASALAAHCVGGGYTHVVACSSSWAKDWSPRLAAALDVSPVTEVVEVVDATTFVRPMYAGNALATTATPSDKVVVATVRSTAFDKAEVGPGSASIEPIDLAADRLAPKVLSTASKPASDRPDLATAKCVVSGGRGMKTGENFGLLDDLASKLDGAVGASRAAVDAGMAPNELQVGQTGKVVAPDLYVAVGISGAIQHLSGMKDSKNIVAINKDAEAPIFQVADIGLVADLFDAVPDMTNKLS